MSEGSHAYHRGVSYTEHHGTGISLLFGQEMVYVVGSEHKTIVGMESKLNVGAIADVGLVTKVELEFGAEIQWVGGAHFVMAGHGGGVFDEVYGVSAGKTDLTAFKKTKLFLKSIVCCQLGAAAVSIASARTTWMAMMPEVQKDGELKIDGNSGFFAVATVNGQILSLATVILSIALYWILNKQNHLTPISAMSINHLGYGFLGVSATPAGGALATGSSGLALSPLSFNLSWDNSHRHFEHKGHSVVGYDTIGKSQIVGNANGVSISSTGFSLVTQHTAAPVAVGPATKASTSRVGITATPSNAELDLLAAGTTEKSNLTLGAGTFTLEESNTAKTRTSTLKASSNGLSLTSSLAGGSTGFLKLKGADVVLEATSTTPPGTGKVSLTSTRVVISQGASNSITMDASGVQIAGALTILNPGVGIPDAAAIASIAAETAKDEAERIKSDAEQKLVLLKSELEQTIQGEIATAIMTVEQKINDASIRAGATL
jgi:hypothetical protein